MESVELVHLSDLHIRSASGKAAAFYGDLDAAGRKTRALVGYLAERAPAAHVVITGDLTDSGTSSSIAVARSVLAPLLSPERLTVVPGNHDARTWGNLPRPERARAFPGVWAETFRLPRPRLPFYKPLDERFALIGLDSTRGGLFAAGLLGEPQLAELRALLERCADERRLPIVLLHHHPLHGEAFHGLVDGQALLAVLRDTPTRKPVVLFGHEHKEGLLRRRAATFVAAPSSVVVRAGKLQARLLQISADGHVRGRWIGFSATARLGFEAPAMLSCPYSERTVSVPRTSKRSACPDCGAPLRLDRRQPRHPALLEAPCPLARGEVLVAELPVRRPDQWTCGHCGLDLLVDDRSGVWRVFHQLPALRRGDELELRCAVGGELITLPAAAGSLGDPYCCPGCELQLVVLRRSATAAADRPLVAFHELPYVW
jgi:hypothetical protein